MPTSVQWLVQHKEESIPTKPTSQKQSPIAISYLSQRIVHPHGSPHNHDHINLGSCQCFLTGYYPETPKDNVKEVGLVFYY